MTRARQSLHNCRRGETENGGFCETIMPILVALLTSQRQHARNGLYITERSVGGIETIYQQYDILSCKQILIDVVSFFPPLHGMGGAG
jgi:hypothetical protein